MSEVAEPLSLEEPQAGLLSRAVSVRLRLPWELAAFASLVIIGAGFRFWDLGSRALHHDESLHGFFAYNLFQGNGYAHDPLMHGPFQFFGTALTFVLAGGASDYTVRIFPALFGTILIVLPFFFRHRLGSLGALFAAGLIAFSPTLLYFSRFARNDIYIAVFTLGIVISLWRYLDDRKPLFLYLGAGLLGLSFATKENTFLHVVILLIFLNTWLAADLSRQSRDALKLDRLTTYSLFVLYLPWAWALAALWPFIRTFRESLGLRELLPAADFLIVLGTLSLPQFSAWLQVPLEAVFGIEIDTAPAEDVLGIAHFLGFGVNGIYALLIVAGLIGATAVVGLRWNWRVWAIAAAAFYIPYALLYTSFLTNGDGFASGIWGSLDYWLEQQDVRRGDQPWFYYLMLLPTYEFLALIVAAPALFYYALKGDIFRRFLVFWVVATFVAYTLAAEKMPWLSVHTALPVAILAAYVLGDVFSPLPNHDRLQRVVPQALPFFAAALGMAAFGFAAFGPSGEGWVAFRVLLALSALGGLVWLLRPYDRRGLTVGLAAAVLGALSLFTVRAGITAAYEYGDVPRELLVYTQTSPDVPDVMEHIQEAGRVSGRGKDLPVFVDTTYSWPWYWYLRDYTNVSYGSGASLTSQTDTVFLIAPGQEAGLQQDLDQFQPPIGYRLRWWFPEGGALGGGGYRDIQRDSIFEAGVDFLGSMFQGSTWANWWGYFRDREPPGNLGSLDGVAYFPMAYPVPEAPPLEPAAPSEPLPPPAADDDGRFVLGELGSQPGAFSDPTGLAVDSEGNLYVADTGNHRIQKFDAQGGFIKEVGGKGTESGQFDQPADVAIDREGNVYVADTWNHRIQVFDRDLEFVAAFGRPAGDLENPEPDQMWGPRAVAVDSEGNILVADTGTHRIKKFSPGGEALTSFGERGSGDGQFIEPVGLAIASNGDIWVADVGNARIQRLDADFNFLASYAIDPWGLLEPLNKPYLTLLPDGRLLASDAAGGQVLLIGDDGAVIAALTELGGSAFTFPGGVAFDERGFIYITEPSNGQVLRFPLSDLPAP